MSAVAPAVLRTAEAMRWAAPELTVALAEHAARAAAAAGDDETARCAWGWALDGRIALGEGCSAVVRAVDAVGGPARLGDTPAGARLRLGVAAVARMVGEVAVARELLTQILELTAEPSQLRADALVEVARCTASDPHAPQAQLAERMSAAGKAYVAVGQEAELIGGAVLLGISAEADRLRGRLGHGLVFARAGLDRVRSGLSAPSVAADLSLALVEALLAAGKADAAAQAGDEASAGHTEAGAVAALGWLRLLLVRHQRASGAADQDAALKSLELVVRSLGGRELPELEAACHTTIRELHEQRGDFGAALAASRAAHAAATQHRAAVEAVRLMLARIPRAETASATTATVATAGPHHRAEPNGGPTHSVGEAPDAPVAAEVADATDATDSAHALASVVASDRAGAANWADAPDGARPTQAATLPSEGLMASAVVVHAGFTSGPAAPETVDELLVRMGAKVCGALPTGGRLHPLGDGAVAVVLAGYGADAARQWSDSLRTNLTEHWSELAGDLPAAEFRLALGHQVAGQSFEALIGNLRASLPDREQRTRRVAPVV